MAEVDRIIEALQQSEGSAPAMLDPAGKLTMAPDEISWSALDDLRDKDPEASKRVTMHIKDAARRELNSGGRAANAVQYGDSPWERAQFGAIRVSLVESWQPTTAVDLILIDMLAQSYTMYLKWVEIQQMLVGAYGNSYQMQRRETGGGDLPRVTQAQAMDQAAAMIDRYNRIIARNIRALRDLRRYAEQITIQHAGHVNIGMQQLNTTGQVAPATSTIPDPVFNSEIQPSLSDTDQ